MTLAEVREWVNDVLSEPAVLGVGGGEERLMIEFILPRSLVHQPVDHWHFGRELGFIRRLGIVFPVVIRSLERLRRQSLHPQWRRKWEWLQRNSERVGVDAVRWVRRGGQQDPQALYAELITEETPACVVLAFAPQPGSEFGQDEFSAALVAGAPAIVWCRTDADPDMFESELRGLLDGRGVAALPEQVLRWRRQAAGRNPASIVHQLAVLWDDPLRIPQPGDQLRPPA